MGTRGILGVVVEGEAKIAYNHFDSYPSGLGEEILEFLTLQDLEVVKTAAKALNVVKDGRKPTLKEQQFYREVADLSVSEQSPNDWYCLLRKYQGIDGLKGMVTGQMRHIEDSSSFAKDSLFCEWGYILNMDTQKLEVYKGFQTRLHKKGRFAEDDKPKDWKPEYKGKSYYYPIKLVMEIPFPEINKNLGAAKKKMLKLEK